VLIPSSTVTCQKYFAPKIKGVKVKEESVRPSKTSIVLFISFRNSNEYVKTSSSGSETLQRKLASMFCKISLSEGEIKVGGGGGLLLAVDICNSNTTLLVCPTTTFAALKEDKKPSNCACTE